LSRNRNADIIKCQLQELKRLKQSLQLDVYKEINSTICYKTIFFLNKFELMTGLKIMALKVTLHYTNITEELQASKTDI